MCSASLYDIRDTFPHNLSIMYLFVSNLLPNMYIIKLHVFSKNWWKIRRCLCEVLEKIIFPDFS